MSFHTLKKQQLILKATWEVARQASGSPLCDWESLGTATKFICGWEVTDPPRASQTCAPHALVAGPGLPGWPHTFLVPLLDVDECLEQKVRCGPNRMCFNMRGSYQCIDTPCPPNYRRDPVSGYVLPSLPRHAFESPSSSLSLLDQQTLFVVMFNSQEVTTQGDMGWQCVPSSMNGQEMNSSRRAHCNLNYPFGLPRFLELPPHV